VPVTGPALPGEYGNVRERPCTTGTAAGCRTRRDQEREKDTYGDGVKGERAVDAELEQLAAEQAALRRVATLVARGELPAAVFAAVAEETGRVLAADLVTLGRYDPDDTITIVATWSAAGDAIPVGLSAPVSRFEAGRLVRETSRPARIDHYQQAAITYRLGARTGVGAPITVDGRLWGFVAAGTRYEDRRLPPGTEDRLAAFTELAATAIANGQARQDLQKVADEQAALRRVATLVARGARPEKVFAAVNAEIGRVLSADFTSMSRYDAAGAVTVVGLWSRTGVAPTVTVGDRFTPSGRNLATLVFQTGRPARIDDYRDASGPTADAARSWGYRSSLGVPITVEGRLWGVASVAWAREAAVPPDTEARMAGFTELVATAIANAEAQAELTASRARIAATADETRRRIERDLHDGAQQRLVSLALHVRAAQAAVPPELGELAAELGRIARGLASTLDELREFARGVHPSGLAEAGLAPVLKTLAARSPVPVQLDVRITTRLPERTEVTAYYVISEALANAAKHAQASAVTVDVGVTDGVLSVSVRDNGSGGADLARGTGLVGLKDRVEAIGGKFVVDSRPGEGTGLIAELPAGPGT